LIFCPTMILHSDKDKTRYLSLQTGLGCDPGNGDALFPYHDALLPVNVKITDEDFKHINNLRDRMSQLVFTANTSPFADYPNLNDTQKYELQAEIKNLMTK
jgi:hypothetical protein